MTSVDQAATGWRLVPVEATEEMVLAGVKCAQNNHADFLQDAYRAMLSAAPQPGMTAEEVAGAVERLTEVAADCETDINSYMMAGSVAKEHAADLRLILALISTNSTQKEQGA